LTHLLLRLINRFDNETVIMSITVSSSKLLISLSSNNEAVIDMFHNEAVIDR